MNKKRSCNQKRQCNSALNERGNGRTFWDDVSLKYSIFSSIFWWTKVTEALFASNDENEKAIIWVLLTLHLTERKSVGTNVEIEYVE